MSDDERDDLRTRVTDAIDHDRASAYDEGRRKSDKRSVWLIVAVAVVAVIAILGSLMATKSAIDIAANRSAIAEGQKLNSALAKDQEAEAAKLQKQIDKLNEQRAAEGKPPVTSASVPDSDLAPDTKKLVQLVLAALPAPVPGPAGPSGASVTGPAGQSGAPGKDGSDGVNGQDGASITNVALNACVLTITVTDADGTATDYPLGNVCGADGAAGPAGRGVQSVDSSCQGGELVQTWTFTDGTTETDTVDGSTVCATTTAPPTTPEGK